MMGQQPTLISEAYGRALNFWEPPSSDTATGTKANTWSQAAVSAEASAPHRLARDLPKVGGAMSGATQNLGGAGQEKGVDQAGTPCRPRVRLN